MSDDAAPATRTWYVLQHTRGPAVPAGADVADHPGIAEHHAFLQRRMAAGELVAAGPWLDERGSGMTILDVASAAEANRLATVDDRAVAGGVLDVDVRPWHVVMTRL
jgi:uncharacterized protein YciI